MFGKIGLKLKKYFGGSCLIGWYYSEYPEMKYILSSAPYRVKAVSSARKNN
ncbi:hypothetical protein [Methanosarcina lacustris]|uniref:hypothetical protein n=1 Tax=Methanosarcina lacustris TaxID=170861 RepID=UPI000B1B1DA2|nr:hypothetical protein [Methanosarcina lacustris]